MGSLMLSSYFTGIIKRLIMKYSGLTFLFPLMSGGILLTSVFYNFFFFLKDFTEPGLTTQSIILFYA